MNTDLSGETMQKSSCINKPRRRQATSCKMQIREILSAPQLSGSHSSATTYSNRPIPAQLHLRRALFCQQRTCCLNNQAPVNGLDKLYRKEKPAVKTSMSVWSASRSLVTGTSVLSLSTAWTSSIYSSSIGGTLVDVVDLIS